MPLYIRDETANALLLTIDNSGLICFGNGTPVSQLTVNGTAVIDADGNITNQRAGSSALAAGSGTVSVGPGQTATIITLAGVVPTVQLDASWPNIQTTHVRIPVDHCVSTPIYNTPSHKVLGTQTGQFRVSNVTRPSDDGVCSTGIADEVVYRWM
jgi:hypothetical protein